MTKSDRTRQPSYVLIDDNIVEHIYAQQELKEQTRAYFHFSPLWRAIQNHISCNRVGKNEPHNMRDVVLIDPPWDFIESENSYLSVRCYSGSGYAVYFKDAVIYGRKGDAKNVEVKIEVEWVWDTYDDSCTRTYTIKIPVTLCKDFSPEAFDKWITEVKKEKDEQQHLADKKSLEDMLRRHPNTPLLRQLLDGFSL